MFHVEHPTVFSGRMTKWPGVRIAENTEKPRAIQRQHFANIQPLRKQHQCGVGEVPWEYWSTFSISSGASELILVILWSRPAPRMPPGNPNEACRREATGTQKIHDLRDHG